MNDRIKFINSLFQPKNYCNWESDSFTEEGSKILEEGSSLKIYTKVSTVKEILKPDVPADE